MSYVTRYVFFTKNCTQGSYLKKGTEITKYSTRIFYGTRHQVKLALSKSDIALEIRNLIRIKLNTCAYGTTIEPHPSVSEQTLFRECLISDERQVERNKGRTHLTHLKLSDQSQGLDGGLGVYLE